MREFSTKLTDEEIECLAILMEEMSEASQIIGKILRHGYNSYNPNDPKMESNRTLLSVEVGHVRFIVGEMCKRQDISAFIMQSAAESKKHTIKQYLHSNPFKEANDEAN